MSVDSSPSCLLKLQKSKNHHEKRKTKWKKRSFWTSLTAVRMLSVLLYTTSKFSPESRVVCAMCWRLIWTLTFTAPVFGCINFALAVLILLWALDPTVVFEWLYDGWILMFSSLRSVSLNIMCSNFAVCSWWWDLEVKFGLQRLPLLTKSARTYPFLAFSVRSSWLVFSWLSGLAKSSGACPSVFLFFWRS